MKKVDKASGKSEKPKSEISSFGKPKKSDKFELLPAPETVK
jgi:hypothetical protein